MKRALPESLRSLLVTIFVASVTACTGTSHPGDAAVEAGDGTDALSTTDAPRMDAPSDVSAGDNGTDAPAACTTDDDCSDHVYCNGAERCMPGASGADARGCTAAPTTNPCMAGQTCNEAMQRCDTMCDVSPDADHDGHNAAACGGDDCDDADGNRFPGNTEVCALDSMNRRVDPTHDEDCDPMTVSNAGSHDGDHDSDGYVDVRCCNATSPSAMHCGDDCEDVSALHGFDGTPAMTTVAASDVHPTQGEVCNGVDDNCNGMVDEGVTVTFYRDCDGDGFGDATDTGMSACFASQVMACSGHVAVNNRTDCDDANDAIHPGSVETCDTGMADENCNGLHNEGCTCIDGASIPCGSTLPGCTMGTQTCAGGMYASCSVSTTIVPCFADADGDGFAPTGAGSSLACVCPIGTTARAPADAANTDCNDANSLVHPGATETCNAIDDNCDGATDEMLTRTCYPDADHDTFAPSGSTASERCPAAGGSCPTGFTAQAPSNMTNTDCNDTNSAIQPGAAEVCNGFDDDCDGMIDEGVSQTFYRDCDGDGYGDRADGGLTGCLATDFTACGTHPRVTNHTDCDDSQSAVNPAASEVCDAAMVDENCSGAANEGCSCVNGSTIPCGSSLNGCATGTQTCAAGTYGMCSVTNTFVTCYVDADNDGFAPMGATSSMACTCGSGTTLRAPVDPASTDCNDTTSVAHPGATEVCDTIDNNCNGTVDEGLGSTYYRDVDGDTYGDPGAPIRACSQPGGTSLNSLDCNDANAAIRPGATEVCNGVDDNCNGTVDDGAGPTWYRDADADSYGNLSSPLRACSMPAGYVSNSTDCDDAYATAHPGQTAFFGTPRTGGSYDYDCSGTEVKLYTTLGSGCSSYGFGCCPTGGGTCANMNGWANTITVPACGVTAAWGCAWNTTVLACQTRTTQTQACN